MGSSAVKWGLVSTLKATSADILNFCAFHLDQGAHRLYIYLDNDNPDAFKALKSHSKIRVTQCDDRYWEKTARTRPVKHQQRQSANAMHAYQKRREVDWLAHIDVDEFIWPLENATISNQLSALPATCLTARLRPIEALAPDGTPTDITYFKACSADRPTRIRQTSEVYPTYANYLNGGFLSHVQGKTFFRTDIEGLQIRIHNVFLDGETNPQNHLLDGLELCHLHAKTWQDWLRTYRFRLDKGSYRAELKPAMSAEKGGLTLHQLFAHLEMENGEDGLRHFFNEVCLATPELRQNLADQGNLRALSLHLTRKRALHFPDFMG
ncbi:MAG: glycosyltransferase family 2 protein [Rhodobacterales bacterium]|nr:glycosyltransferase family 2 protein [Rhodobacterales bacterium]